MTNVAPDEAQLEEAHTAHVTKSFTRLYYHILNDNPEYLHQFYGQTSSITVSETQDDGTNLTVRADTLELIKALTLQMFADVRVTLTNCTPQTSLSGSIQLMVSGVMQQKNCDEERLFTQAMLLAKQDQGYYVLNDTVHVHSRSSSWKVLSFRKIQEDDKAPEPTAEPEANTPTPEKEAPAETPVADNEVQLPEQPPIPEDNTAMDVTPAVQMTHVAEKSPVSMQSHAFEDEPTQPPKTQAQTAIEKPTPSPPQPSAQSAPGPSAKRSYKDALNTMR